MRHQNRITRRSIVAVNRSTVVIQHGDAPRDSRR
jgi:hypothetical protein